jgi:hypothetical protein
MRERAGRAPGANPAESAQEPIGGVGVALDKSIRYEIVINRLQ